MFFLRRGRSISQDAKEILRKARARHGLSEDTYNFAFAGHYIAGKCSLINALRGLRNSDVGAAKADVVQCTTTITKYTASGELAHLCFFDVAGTGAVPFPEESYFRDNALMAFDCTIIMIKASLREDEVAYARLCKKYGQPVVVVRSKCDEVLRNQLEDGQITEISAATAKQLVKTLATIHHEIVRSWASDLADVPFFCVSAGALHSCVTGQNASNAIIFQEAEFREELLQITKKGRKD